MSGTDVRISSEQESRELAEQARQKEWEGRAFIRELYLGGLPLDLVHPFPAGDAERPEFRAFYDGMRDFLKNDVDSVAIDQTGEYPEKVLDGLRKLGAFGMKIPKEYGGLGFSVSEYCKVMELVGSSDGNLGALLSAHQSIGVPQPSSCSARPSRRRSTCRVARPARSPRSRSPNRTSAPIRRACRRPRELDGDYLRPERREALVHERHDRGASGRHGAQPEDEEDQRLRRRDRVARGQGRVSLPLHGSQGARQRRDQLQGRARPEGEPDRPGRVRA